MLDYYALLGVTRFTASQDDIRRAYREQIAFFHPDKGYVNEHIALERTQQLNEVYDTLKNPEKRAVYDAELAEFLKAAPKPEPPMPEPEPDPPQPEEPKPEEPKTEKPKPEPAGSHPAQASSREEKASLGEIFSHAWDMLPARFAVLIAVFMLLFSISMLNMLAQSISHIGSGKEIDSGVFAVNEYQHKLLNSTVIFDRNRDRIHDTVEFLESPDAGYGSPYFYTDQKLIVMKRDDEPQPLQLSISYPGSLSIYTNQDSDAAEIVFEENVWYEASTTMHVKADHPGTTVITFSNNRNFDTFRVRNRFIADPAHLWYDIWHGKDHFFKK